MKALRLALACLVPALACRAAAAAPGPTVSLSREGGVFRLRAAFDTRASAATAWGVLTDYDHMTGFVSSLRSSRVVSRSERGVIIEQEGLVRLLLLSRRVLMTLTVVEHPTARLEFSAARNGPFEEYDGTWLLSESSGATHVSYELFAEIKGSLVPRGVARRALNKSIAEQLCQVQREIERRAFAGDAGR